MKLIEFSFDGTPVSFQTNNRIRKRAYMNRITALASGIIASNIPNLNDELEAKITYFYQSNTDLDIDNIIKPILDSLNGVFYTDDSQISEVNSKRIDLNGSYIIENNTPLLATQLTKGIEFVYFELFKYKSIF